MLNLFKKMGSPNTRISKITKSEYYRQEIRNALLLNCYPQLTDHSNLSDVIIADLEEHIEQRMLGVENQLIPWLTEVVELKNKTIVEIGCGTGSMTIPFAMRSKKIIACDVWEAIEVAKTRAKLFCCKNVLFKLNNFHWLSEDASVEDFFCDVGEFDIITLDAVLEHLTIGERLRLLKFAWERLKSDGIMVICETPNRLAYFDSHTYLTHFFHSLPDELARQYALKFSKRTTLIDELKQRDWQTRLYKSGRGVSYHEFELAIDFNQVNVLADGTSPYLAPENEHSYYGLLRNILKSELPHIPKGFSTEWINLVIKKN